MLREILFLALVYLIRVRSENSQVDGDYSDIFEPDASHTTMKAPVEAREDASEEFSGIDNCTWGEKCVPSYLCDAEGFINTGGNFLVDEQRDEPSSSLPPTGSCASAFQMCCKIKDFTNLTKEEFCNQTLVKPECGCRNEDGIGGLSASLVHRTLFAKYAELPWMVAILQERKILENVLMIFISGGSLISPKVALTSAHNVVNFTNSALVVRAGEWSTQTEIEPCLHEDRKVQEVIKHENFTRSNLNNDLSLLILDSAFPMTPFINTICLPPKRMNFDNQRCLFSGWGKTENRKNSNYQDYLKKVELQVVPSRTCEKQLRMTRLGEDFKLHDGFLCAGGGGEEGKNVCKGDGGSPLVCEMSSFPNHFYQVGIVAGGIGCGAEKVPGLFVDISKYREWIDEKLAEKEIAHKSYTSRYAETNKFNLS